MLIGAIIGNVCLLVGGIAFLVWRISTRRSRIWLKTLDQAAVLKELMFWAAPKIPGRTGQLIKAQAFSVTTYDIAALQSVSREHLAILVPYIDEWIAGKLPPQNLPAEYEDYRPRVLLAFKQRLQSEGRWPLTSARKRFVDSEKRA